MVFSRTCVVPGEKHVAVVLGCRKTLVGGGGRIRFMHLFMNVENAPPTFGGLHFRQCSSAVFNLDSSGSCWSGTLTIEAC